MLYERTSDPVHDAAVYDRQQAVGHRRWLAGCPECEECGKPIEDEKCYVVDSQTCICEDCKERKLAEVRRISPILEEMLDDAFFLLWKDTPHDDDAEEDIA